MLTPGDGIAVASLAVVICVFLLRSGKNGISKELAVLQSQHETLQKEVAHVRQVVEKNTKYISQLLTQLGVIENLKKDNDKA